MTNFEKKRGRTPSPANRRYAARCRDRRENYGVNQSRGFKIPTGFKNSAENDALSDPR